MSYNREALKTALSISESRPVADMTIEQFLMTPESMARQLPLLDRIFRDKRVLFLGDDDHMSVMLGKYLGVKPTVAEYDDRVRSSLKLQYGKNEITDYRIEKYDARKPLPKAVRADAFYINPPYSSKNNGKGAKVWINRVSSAVPVGSVSVLVYPIDEDLKWTLECTTEIIRYAYDCGFVIVDIDRDVHAYEYVNDPGLLSSNIYLYKIKDVEVAGIESVEGEALYR